MAEPLLIDQFMPESDLAVVHSRVFRAPPEQRFKTVVDFDLFQLRAFRVLIGASSADRWPRESLHLPSWLHCCSNVGGGMAPQRLNQSLDDQPQQSSPSLEGVLRPWPDASSSGN